MQLLSWLKGQSAEERRFETLVWRHYQVLYRTAWRWTRSVEEAEDLVQEACTRAWARLDEIEALERPVSWIMRVMYRLFVDATRRHERRFADALDDAASGELMSDAAGPDDLAERSQLAGSIHNAWLRMERDRRALLTMHDIEGYTLAELAETTGLKVGTLKSRLHRSRVLLGRLLEQEQNRDRRTARAGG